MIKHNIFVNFAIFPSILYIIVWDVSRVWYVTYIWKCADMDILEFFLTFLPYKHILRDLGPAHLLSIIIIIKSIFYKSTLLSKI